MQDPIGFHPHDHSDCISAGVERADAVCRESGARLTPVRRRVLELLLQRHKAMGAYDVLEVLREEGLGSQPPVAYRALEFLVAQGFAHRIERLNAFIACAHLDDLHHAPAFLICRVCNRVAESASNISEGPLRDAAEAAGFRIERATIEALGLCTECQSTEPA